MENTIHTINKNEKFPKVIDCENKNTDDIIDFIDTNCKNYNILGINLSENKYNVLLNKYKYLKYSKLGRVLSVINFSIKMSHEKIGIVCFDDEYISLFEELFDCLIMFGIRAKRIYFFDTPIDKTCIYECDYVLIIEDNCNLSYIKNVPIINISNTLNTILSLSNKIKD